MKTAVVTLVCLDVGPERNSVATDVNGGSLLFTAIQERPILTRIHGVGKITEEPFIEFERTRKLLPHLRTNDSQKKQRNTNPGVRNDELAERRRLMPGVVGGE
jgi:hypothetical protein